MLAEAQAQAERMRAEAKADMVQKLFESRKQRALARLSLLGSDFVFFGRVRLRVS